MVKQNLRVFAYIVWDYKSAAEATSLLSSVALLAKKVSKLFTEKQRRTNSYSRITSSSEPKFERFSV